MAGETKVKDYVPSPCGTYQAAKVKKGRALFGEIRKYPNGTTIYWAFRKPDEVFLELDAWAIDTETIRVVKSKGCTHVGVLVTNGDRYLTTIERMTDKNAGAVVLNYSNHVGQRGKVGARQWYLPRSQFIQSLAPAEQTLDLMRIRARR
ncbi:hypothetical protein [Burkholderia vietnamiensis]|uniref:hypothetical protein n=1 Tax=Burkholderia vietnamiensis TaxID=60552 RepID=UPI001CACB815|nr:hypothetical protein [Burkholderia vietnamiensis]CAG9229139.1 conserved hypothetical protein [Burkholderia vietnamiensis]HDR9086312.1 hypothetical protein [Burkholderia vietnamiensis]